MSVEITVQAPAGLTDDEHKRLSAAIRKAGKGDQAPLATIKDMLGEAPGAPAFWQRLGEKAWIKTFVGEKDLLLIEGVKQRLAAMRQEVARPTPSPLEALLADRVVLCWLQLQYAEAWLAQKNQRSVSLAQGEYYQRQAERAQRRYVAAIKALATVRRLLTPTVQVNIAEQQVNVAGVVRERGDSVEVAE
jgi:hypothetical protein